MEKNTYIQKEGVYYLGVLKDVRKSANPLRPILEAFTNSLESISLIKDKEEKGEITIKLFFHKNLLDFLEFERIEIEDSGVGFNDENFERILIYKDTRKGFNNKGSGRIQLVHFFDKSEYESIYQDDSGFKKRKFTLSKSKPFLDKNTLIYHNDTAGVEAEKSKTTLTLTGLNEKADTYYNSLRIADLKDALTNHYMLYFCSHREQMPKIILEQYANNNLLDKLEIKSADIPAFDKEENLSIYYSQLSADGKSITKTTNKEDFILRAFKIEKNKLEKNAIKLTSKHEIVENVKVSLACLSPDDHVDGNRYLFLLSGSYIDSIDSDTRGEFQIPNKEEFKKNNDLFSHDEILLDDIQDVVNDKVISIYSEINDKTKKKKQEVEKLKAMFLLNEETLKDLTIHLNDSEERILEKVYAAEAKNIAKKDAEIKQKIDDLENLNPTSNDYEQKFEIAISELVKQIPLQNRTTLTHYVARRTLVLELFQKILDKKLNVQKTTSRNIDEELLHNLIFQQGSNNSYKSDLWIISEDFIYFKGASDNKLGNVEIHGKKIFKEVLTSDEEIYRLSLGEDRYSKEPDVLLFPEENKCIIIEFKNPSVNVSEHLNQINRYATLIRNFTKDEFQFDTFYGYLIGENIDADDVRAFDSDFKHSYHFDFVFRPSKAIVGKFGRKDGAIYTEVIKYSSLLERSKKRNSIFTSKILE